MGLLQQTGMTGNNADGTGAADHLPNHGNLAQGRCHKGKLCTKDILIKGNHAAVSHSTADAHRFQLPAGFQQFAADLIGSIHTVHKAAVHHLVSDRVGERSGMAGISGNPGRTGAAGFLLYPFAGAGAGARL